MIFRMIATLFVAVVFQNAYPAFLFADDNTSPNNVWAKLSAKKSHPRYLLTDSKVKQLRDHYEDEAKKADNTHSVDFRWYKRMRVHASRIADILEGVPADKLDQPASWAKAEYDANLNTGYYDFNFTMSQTGANVNPKQVVNVVRILAFTYLIESGNKNTNTRKYSDSVWKVIKRLETGLTDAEWNKMQDLDRSDCITAAAIAFDWCHDTELKQMPKQRVANIIWNRGIIPFHQKVVADSIEDWDQYKPSNNSNWTHWAYTGVLAGVIVVDGVDGERKREQLLKKSVEYLKVFRKIYEDWEGGWLEGTSYAETSASGLARIYGGLESSTGIDFGSDYDTKWVRRFSNFIPHLTGPDRLWTFGDSTDWTTDSPAMLWFASVFNDKQLQRYAIDRIVRMGDFLPMPEHLIWYREMSGLPESFDKKYSMQYLDVAVMKSDNGKTFFAAKGNRSGRHVQVGAGHYHLDAGDFRFETQGVRFTDDLPRVGYDKVHKRGMFNIYEHRAEGHNTLVINPLLLAGMADKSDQAQGVICPIVSEPTGNPRNDVVAINLTNAYKQFNTNSVMRGFKLYNDDRSLLIIDRIEFKALDDRFKGENDRNRAYWQMHTPDDATDEKAAVLTFRNTTYKVFHMTRRGEKVRVTLRKSESDLDGVYPHGFEFDHNAKGYSYGPNAGKHSGFSKLTLPIAVNPNHEPITITLVITIDPIASEKSDMVPLPDDAVKQVKSALVIPR